MGAIPAIYGNLSDEAKAAYARWNDALMAKADHTINCRVCDVFPLDGCGTGIALYEHEQRVWSEWNDARRLERK